jgi:deoxyribonuclease V
MLACLDVDYREPNRARAACILFAGWSDPVSAETFAREMAAGGDYQPGEFYRRELPCLLAILGEVGETLDAIVIDGYVWLDGAGERAGLGAHLWRALQRATPVIGVAKNPFAGAAAIEVLRGESGKPLHVTAAGLDPGRAAEHIAAMHGDYRIPTLLRAVDQLSRDWAP